MVDIKQELLHQRDLRVAKETIANKSALAEVEDLLKIETTEDTSMLSYFGTQETLAKAKKKAAELKSFGPNTQVTYKDVEIVCKKYALKCLPASQYQKSMPVSVLHNLRKFESELDEHLQGKTEGSYSYRGNPNGKIDPERLLVIAPKSHFKVNGTFKIQRDPVLLYITEGSTGSNRVVIQHEFTENEYANNYVYTNNSFQIIDKWGKDFTLFRRLKGLFQYSIIANIILFALCLYGSFKGADALDNITPGAIPVYFLLACAIAYVIWASYTWKREDSWSLDA